MEAVPRLPMLSCELKQSPPENTEFEYALKKYIHNHYHEDPETYNKEIKDLEALRQSACKVPHDFTGCSILKRYYCQLDFLQNRFILPEERPGCVAFTWNDIYTGTTFNIADIKYEQASILYNIGALHSELGAKDNRITAEGMKIACTHFQCAAWAFQHIRENYAMPKGCDMSHDLLTFYINIMLAQAQECILEKSMLDSRKSSITAKVAAQVVEYYQTALATLLSGSSNVESGCILHIVGSKIFKSWKKFVEFKISYYGSISHLYMGNQAEEQQKMGDRVAWYQSALDKLDEAIKISKFKYKLPKTINLLCMTQHWNIIEVDTSRTSTSIFNRYYKFASFNPFGQRNYKSFWWNVSFGFVACKKEKCKLFIVNTQNRHKKKRRILESDLF